MFEIVLKKQFNIEIHSYCSQTQKGVWCWNPKKLKNTVLDEILNKEWKNKFSYGLVKSVHLKTIILYYSDNSKLNEVVENLRHVEENLRNMAAHQIISVDEEKLQMETGFTGKQIMDNIKQLFMYTGMNVKQEYWNSYDELNDLIYKKMEPGKTATE